MYGWKSTRGNKNEVNARASVSFETKDPIENCAQDIAERLKKDYAKLVEKSKISDL